MTNDFGTAAVFRGSHEQKIININHWQFFSKTLDVCQSIPWNHPSWFSHMWLLIMPDLFRRNIIYVLIPKIKCKKWICVSAIVYPHITMLIIGVYSPLRASNYSVMSKVQKYFSFVVSSQSWKIYAGLVEGKLIWIHYEGISLLMYKKDPL